MSTTLALLKALLRKDMKWKRDSAQQRVFEKSKELLVSSQVLVHYDSPKEIIVSCDASQPPSLHTTPCFCLMFHVLHVIPMENKFLYYIMDNKILNLDSKKDLSGQLRLPYVLSGKRRSIHRMRKKD